MDNEYRKRLVIVDRDAADRHLLRSLLTSLCPDVEICGEAAGVKSGYTLISQTRPQALLLDIDLNDGSGFDLLDHFPQPTFQVIFITASKDYALRAFRYQALDYLLKPVNPKELRQNVDRLRTAPPQEFVWRDQQRPLDKIALSSMQGIVFLRLDEIIRLASEGSYTTFHALNERHLVTRPIRYFETLLPESRFFKLHQSHIINLAYVQRILHQDGGYALLEDGARIPIARRRREAFLQVMRLQAFW